MNTNQIKRTNKITLKSNTSVGNILKSTNQNAFIYHFMNK